MEIILKLINWPVAARMAQHPLARSALLMLPVGYLVLWSDALSDLFRFKEKFSSSQLFETDTRLILVYYGAICVVAGITLFSCFCPRVCKKYMDGEEYFNNTIQPQNVTQLRVAVDRIDIDCRCLLKGLDMPVSILRTEMKPFYIGEHMIADQELSGAFVSNDPLRQALSRLLAVHFSCMKQVRFGLCFLSISFMLIGIAGVLLPSLEIFVLVFAKTTGILEIISTKSH